MSNECLSGTTVLHPFLNMSTLSLEQTDNHLTTTRELEPHWLQSSAPMQMSYRMSSVPQVK